jgi:hypothetical protein
MEYSYLINYFTDMQSCPCTTIWAWKKTKSSSKKGKRPQEERSQMGGHCWLVIETCSPVSVYKRKCLGSAEKLLCLVPCPPNTLGNSCQVFMVGWDAIPSGGRSGPIPDHNCCSSQLIQTTSGTGIPKSGSSRLLHVSPRENLQEVKE